MCDVQPEAFIFASPDRTLSGVFLVDEKIVELRKCVCYFKNRLSFVLAKIYIDLVLLDNSCKWTYLLCHIPSLELVREY